MVRRFKGLGGVEKIQLRVDLGILQMNAEGRPDGRRPFGHPSLLEYYQARLEKFRQENGEAESFILNSEECSKLQLEALQYHHRYICCLQLEDFDAVIRDTERNLTVFDLVREHAESSDLGWSLQQLRPQSLMMRTRALAAKALSTNDFPAAIREVEEGIEQIRRFFQESPRPEFAENSGEIHSLETWLEDLRVQRPLSKREQLEKALAEALRTENYEQAAKVRDELRRLEVRE